jgi:hypothetical protein
LSIILKCAIHLTNFTMTSKSFYTKEGRLDQRQDTSNRDPYIEVYPMMRIPTIIYTDSFNVCTFLLVWFPKLHALH